MGTNKARVTGNIEVQTVPNNLRPSVNMEHKFFTNFIHKVFDHSLFKNLKNDKAHTHKQKT